ncbi:hypothetical protein HPB48_010033 [Haemaphysalis longicornis]|uniref:Large ribosomal subunit protein uL1 n=1 Tax=Haemaphysalis longicornis TaxID=44386 RepID=A0A9J6GSF9_HAELO|nr:hypothetical protein HPB48_010033 [Haemaphysalis longicornis]
MEYQRNLERLHRCVAAVLEASARKRRRFLEFVDLQIAFTDNDFFRDKCIEFAVVMNHIPKPGLRVCVLGDAGHCEEARANDLPFTPSRDLRALDKHRHIKQLTNDFDVFVASHSVRRWLKHSPLGLGLKMADKWPKLLSHRRPLVEQVDKVKATARFRFGGESPRGLVVGNVGMSPRELAENIDDVVKHMEVVLRENWRNVRSMHIKSTMGPPQRIY